MSCTAGKRRIHTITGTAIENIFERANNCMITFSQVNNSLEEQSSFEEVLIEKYNKAIDKNLINLIEEDGKLQNEENLAYEFSLLLKKNI